MTSELPISLMKCIYTRGSGTISKISRRKHYSFEPESAPPQEVDKSVLLDQMERSLQTNQAAEASCGKGNLLANCM